MSVVPYRDFQVPQTLITKRLGSLSQTLCLLHERKSEQRLGSPCQLGHVMF